MALCEAVKGAGAADSIKNGRLHENKDEDFPRAYRQAFL
jgi:hypothetical protein